MRSVSSIMPTSSINSVRARLWVAPFPHSNSSKRSSLPTNSWTLANPAIVVTDDGEPIGVLTRQDIIGFLSTSSGVK